MSVALMMCICLTPVVSESVEADSESEVIEDIEAMYGIDTMAITPIGGAGLFALGLIVGVAVTALYYHFQDPANPAADQEEVYKQCRELYAERMVTNWDTAKNLISSVMPADTSLWAFTTNYWNRATELAVADYWTWDREYSPNLMTEEAGLRLNVMNYTYDWQAAIDNAYNEILKRNASLTGDCYGNMNVFISWDQGRMDPADSSEDIYMDLLMTVHTGNQRELVYIDTSDYDVNNQYNSKTSGRIYSFGQDVTLTYLGGEAGSTDIGDTYHVYENRVNDIAGWPSGLYRIDTYNATLAGPLSQASDDNPYYYINDDALGDGEISAAEVSGALLIGLEGDSLDLALVTSAENDAVDILHDDKTVNSSSLKIEIDYDGLETDHNESVLLGYPTAGGNDAQNAGVYYDIVGDWNRMIQQINEIIGYADVAGEAIWGIFDIAEESNSLISPSTIYSNVEGMHFNAEQVQAIYIEAMMQTADYYEENGGDFESAQFEIGMDEVERYVWGDIYYNGQLWAENVVFTPYMTLDTQQIVLNQKVEWTGPGFAMVWAQVDDFDDWTGSTSSTDYELIDLSKGYVIEAKRIVVDNQLRQSLTISPELILRDTTGSDPSPTPPEPVKVADASLLTMLILISVALNLFLICYIWNQPVIGLILAMIVLFIGLVGSDWIANLIINGW